ncbi:DUF4956 domain-containing protein [bacterium]|nr:DUF4956 domain-containing protein [bacterium]
MNIDKIFYESFPELITIKQLSYPDIMTVLAIVSLLGIYIFIIYNLICKKTFYSKSFGISLIAVAVITAIIILAVKQSIIISLGMVGALSIVRFRTPVKEPLDLVFIFWAISIGIICGANLYLVAVLGSLTITIVLIAMHFIPNMHNSLLLVINADRNIEETEIINNIKEYTNIYSIRSRNANKETIDFVIEIKIKKEKEALLVKSFSKNEHILNVSLMSYDGELI